MKNRALGAILFFALVIAPAPAAGCNMVYGSDWAFVSQAPEDWNSDCSDGAMEDTSITLWPANESQSTASALIYVTVSDRDPRGLAAFAAYEQQSFKTSSPTSSVTAVATSLKTKHEHLLARYHHASQGREELVAYVAGPSAYYLIVLTAVSESSLASHQSVFLAYVQDFIPMSRK